MKIGSDFSGMLLLVLRSVVTPSLSGTNGRGEGVGDGGVGEGICGGRACAERQDGELRNL